MKGEGYILIVEDSKTQAKQLDAILKQLGYRIVITNSAREALFILKEQKPVIIISDILMPDIDGYQFCKLLKSDDKLKDIAVILLTQLSDPREIVKGLACGADDFIVKPYNEEFLLARIHATLALKQSKTRQANWPRSWSLRTVQRRLNRSSTCWKTRATQSWLLLMARKDLK